MSKKLLGLTLVELQIKFCHPYFGWGSSRKMVY